MKSHPIFSAYGFLLFALLFLFFLYATR